MEIQVNGGSVEDKVKFGLDLFEKNVPISSVFAENEYLDTAAVNKGHGFEGVVTRWGVTRLPRKTHKGLRKVACMVHGIQVAYVCMLDVLVNVVTIIVPRLTRKFTESAKLVMTNHVPLNKI